LCAVTILGLPDFEVSAAGEYGGELEVVVQTIEGTPGVPAAVCPRLLMAVDRTGCVTSLAPVGRW
jgi:hypothetical protein